MASSPDNIEDFGFTLRYDLIHLFRISCCRKECHHNLYTVSLKAWKFRELGVSSPGANINLQSQAASLSCACLGYLASFDGTSSEWVPVVDQVLLVASMLLTYMAGVTPIPKSSFTSTSVMSEDDIDPETSALPGR